jgi:PRTRC genetic system protein B
VTKKKPTRKPAGVMLPPEAFDSQPTVQLTFTAETLWLTRYDDQGQRIATYPVKVADAAAAFRNEVGLSVATGILPADVLFYHQAQGKPPRIGIWLPAGRRIIHWAIGKRTRKLTIPLPGLLFVGQGNMFWAWAAKARPAKESEPLFQAPLSNVNHDGLICHGNVEFPKAAPDQMTAAAAAFLDSNFNNHMDDARVRLQEGALLAFLQALDGRRTFPTDRLRPAGVTAGQAMRGERGQAVREDEPDDEPLVDLPEDEALDPDVFLGDGEEGRDELNAEAVWA